MPGARRPPRTRHDMLAEPAARGRRAGPSDDLRRCRRGLGGRTELEQDTSRPAPGRGARARPHGPAAVLRQLLIGEVPLVDGPHASAAQFGEVARTPGPAPQRGAAGGLARLAGGRARAGQRGVAEVRGGEVAEVGDEEGVLLHDAGGRTQLEHRQAVARARGRRCVDGRGEALAGHVERSAGGVGAQQIARAGLRDPRSREVADPAVLAADGERGRRGHVGVVGAREVEGGGLLRRRGFHVADHAPTVVEQYDRLTAHDIGVQQLGCCGRGFGGRRPGGADAGAGWGLGPGGEGAGQQLAVVGAGAADRPGAEVHPRGVGPHGGGGAEQRVGADRGAPAGRPCRLFARDRDGADRQERRAADRGDARRAPEEPEAAPTAEQVGGAGLHGAGVELLRAQQLARRLAGLLLDAAGGAQRCLRIGHVGGGEQINDLGVRQTVQPAQHERRTGGRGEFGENLRQRDLLRAARAGKEPQPPHHRERRAQFAGRRQPVRPPTRPPLVSQRRAQHPRGHVSGTRPGGLTPTPRTRQRNPDGRMPHPETRQGTLYQRMSGENTPMPTEPAGQGEVRETYEPCVLVDDDGLGMIEGHGLERLAPAPLRCAHRSRNLPKADGVTS